MVVHGVDIDALSEEQRSALMGALAARSAADTKVSELSKEQDALLEERARAYFAGESEMFELDEVLDSF